jgi:GrpB-like predicted nucleotidyltransferase (UPF0157 family)
MKTAIPIAIPVHLVDHDPSWSVLAAQQMQRLRSLGDLVIDTQHIGSTSVPGIIAKPVVDLIALVRSLDELDLRQVDITLLGYIWHGEFGVDGRRFCTLDDRETGKRLVNLHCYQAGSEHASRQIVFRDYLRAFPDAAQAYSREKRRARDLFPDNSTLYAEEKGEFIRDAVTKALAWERRQGGLRVAGQARSV